MFALIILYDKIESWCYDYLLTIFFTGSPVKKDVIQLWPMLLCKGLLKIASLSLNGLSNGYVDFDMVNCLTGWVPQVIPTKGKTTIFDILVFF